MIINSCHNFDAKFPIFYKEIYKFLFYSLCIDYNSLQYISVDLGININEMTLIGLKFFL